MAITGFASLSDDDLQRAMQKLSSLPELMKNTVLKRVLRDAAELAFNAYKSNLSRMQETGTMLASSKIRAMKKKAARVGYQVVTDATTHDRPGVKRSKHAFPYPYMVEYGHRVGRRTRRIKRLHNIRSAVKTGRASGDFSVIDTFTENVDKRKKVPGKFPMRRAFDATRTAAKQLIIQGIDEAVRNIQGTIRAAKGA